MIVKCPKCGNLVTDRVAECPSCGEILNAELKAAAEPAPVVETVPAVEPAPAVKPAPVAPQSAPVAPQPVPVAPQKKKKSWKGLVWSLVAVLALAGILTLYTMAITRMGLDTIKIEVNFYTRPVETVSDTAPQAAISDTTIVSTVPSAR